MRNRRKIVAIDLWNTILTSRWKSLVLPNSREPIWDVQAALGHKVLKQGEQLTVEPCEDFRRFCLTERIPDTKAFLEAAGRAFNCKPTPESLRVFESILRAEAGNIARFEDVNWTLREIIARGYIPVVISNIWIFVIARIFEMNGLGEFFPPEQRILSCEVGYRKPDPRIYLEMFRRFKVTPDQCYMFGDDPEYDAIASHKLGVKAGLIDRTGEHALAHLPEGIEYLHPFHEIINVLDKEERQAA